MLNIGIVSFFLGVGVVRIVTVFSFASKSNARGRGAAGIGRDTVRRASREFPVATPIVSPNHRGDVSTPDGDQIGIVAAPADTRHVGTVSGVAFVFGEFALGERNASEKNEGESASTLAGKSKSLTTPKSSPVAKVFLFFVR